VEQSPLSVAQAFRRSGARWWSAACISLFLLIFLSGLIAAGPNGTETPSLLQQLVCGVLSAGTLLLIIGVLRQGVWIDDQGIRIRNVFRAYRASWQEVKAIDPPPSYGALRNAGIQIVLRDGRRLNAALYSEGRINTSGFADPVVEALRLAHRQATD
jgi:hypothetical protein